DGEAERLGDVVVGARLEAEDRVGIRVLPGQHDDGGLVTPLPQYLDRFASVHVGKADIHDQEVDDAGTRRLHALRGGPFLLDRELLVQRELLDERGPQVDIVINDQDG